MIRNNAKDFLSKIGRRMIRNNSKCCDQQIDFILQRVKSVENHFSELCDEFAAYARKTGRLRDRGDSLANKVLNYAIGENFNHSLRRSLTKFAEKLAAVQDYREAQIRRIEAKVVSELIEYGGICKQTKEYTRKSDLLRAEELAKKRKLEKIQGQQIVDWQLAEIELQKATSEATKSYKELEIQMDNFESRKLADLKRIFTQFIHIELLFHAKALEIYTSAYNDIADIHVDSDLEEFRNCLRTSSELSRTDIIRKSGLEPQSPKHFSSETQPSTSSAAMQDQDSEKSSSHDNDDEVNAKVKLYC